MAKREYSLTGFQKFAVWFFFGFECLWVVLLLIQLIIYRDPVLFFVALLFSATVVPVMMYCTFALNYGFVGANTMTHYFLSRIRRKPYHPLMVDERDIERAGRYRKRIALSILVLIGLAVVLSSVPIFSKPNPSESWWGRNVYQYHENDTFGMSFGQLTGHCSMADIQPRNGQGIHISYALQVSKGSLTIGIEDDDGRVRWRAVTSSRVSGTISLPMTKTGFYHLFINGNHIKGKVDFTCSDADVTVTGLDDSSSGTIG